MDNTEKENSGFSSSGDFGFLILLLLFLGNSNFKENTKVEELEKEIAELKGKMSIIERKI